MNLTENLRPEAPVSPENRPSEPAGGPDDPRVILVLEEYLAALLAGHKPDRQAFEARHPDIVKDLAACLDGLEFVHAVAPNVSQPGVGQPAFQALLSAENQATAPLGDFRILREIGRGGMGVVYEAEQLSLGRRVALKVLPFAAALDAKHLQRFKHEAQAAAHLHHQNIVPVYGVGCERGVHYYAMQFIDGQPLADLIQQLRRSAGLEEAESAPTGPYKPGHTPSSQEARGTAAATAETTRFAAQSTEPPTEDSGLFRTAAQLGIQAAEALEHAHQLGVVHRDIKPGNLMVDPRGNLWVTDFGLAQFHNDGNLTMTGELLGTIRYMSPEQALAQRVPLDHRTDIYSLGVTLYELLTLEPAFGGTDRQELLLQIASEEPRQPRRLNKAVPPELELIVLKAMEKNAAERYPTAQELADDLRRFLDDRPIRAKRPTLWQKAKRLMRRNKGVVRTVLLALVVALVTVAIAASLDAVRWEKHAKSLGEEKTATLKQLDLTRTAEEEGRRNLYRALVAQARGSRLSRRIGQRFKSQNVLEEATRLARDLNLPEEDFLELRSEAIACLALPDLRVAKEWDGWPLGSLNIDFDGALERYARLDRQGVVSIRRVTDDTEIYHFSGFGPGNFGPGETWPYFSTDGHFLLLHRAGQVKVWRLAGQEPALILEKPACTSHSFSPDSRQIVLGQADGSIHLYDLPSGRQLKQLKSGPGVRGLAFHPGATQLAILLPTSVQIRDLASGNVLADLPQSTGSWHVAWHPDGKTLAVDGGDRIIHLWDVATRKPIARLEGCKADGISFAFNHAGDLLASTCWDGILRLWDPRTGQQMFNTQTSVQSFRFSPDDRLLAVEIDDNKLRMWQVALSCSYRALTRDPLLGKGEYHVCATSPKGVLLAAGMLDGVGLWDLRSGNPLAFLPGRAVVVEFATSEALLTQGPAGLLRWPIQRGSAAGLVRIGPPRKLPMPGNDCWIAASRDGRVVASAQRWGGLVWHQDLPDPPIRLSPHEDTRYITVSPDGRQVATGSHWGTKVKIWDAGTGELVHELPVETSSDVRFSPDGCWLATTGGGCRLWAVDSWREGPHIGGGRFAFSADGKLLAVETGHGVIRLVNPDTGREYARLEDPNQDRSGSLCFSSDGAHLVSTTHDSPSIHVWDLRTIREQLAKMELDWGLPPYPPAGESADRKPLQVQVDLGDDLSHQLAMAKNNDAWPLATCPEAKLRDPRRAVELAKQAVKLAPKEGMYWNTLGVAHYRAGHWEESIAALEKSMKLLSGRFEGFNTFFLAMAHWQRNRKEHAHKWHSQAVEWMEKNKEALEKDKPHQEELRRFRAEAAALLEGKATND